MMTTKMTKVFFAARLTLLVSRLYQNCNGDNLISVQNMQEHGSVVMHLLSQVSVGMDLTSELCR